MELQLSGMMNLNKLIMEKIIIFGVEIEPPKHKEKEEATKRVEEQTFIRRFNVVINFMAEQNHWRFNNMRKYILNLAEIDKDTAIRLVLKKAAIMFDLRYKGHIKDAWRVYTVDEYEYKDAIPGDSDLYRLIPLFRAAEEAKWALDAIKPLLKDEQED